MSEEDGDTDAASSGLLLKGTPAIYEFLQSSSHAHDSPVPYKLLKDAWFAASPSSRPRLRHLLSGSTVIFRSPEPRMKSDELKARLAQLQDSAERKAYQDLVKDVIPNLNEETEYFSSYKNQLGFGLHVAVIMFTGYLAGHILFRSQFGGSPVLHAAGGLSGMVIGMLIETVLFIIRASNVESANDRAKKASKGSRRKKNL